MKKNIKIILLILIIGFIYIEISHHFNLYIPCIIKTITGYFCPGCGVTRMFYSILELDLYKAFRYNMFIFVSLPFYLILLIDYIYSYFKGKDSIVLNLSKYTYIIYIILFILFGILRNIIPILAPLD